MSLCKILWRIEILDFIKGSFGWRRSKIELVENAKILERRKRDCIYLFIFR